MSNRFHRKVRSQEVLILQPLEIFARSILVLFLTRIDIAITIFRDNGPHHVIWLGNLGTLGSTDEWPHVVNTRAINTITARRFPMRKMKDFLFVV